MIAVPNWAEVRYIVDKIPSSIRWSEESKSFGYRSFLRL